LVQEAQINECAVSAYVDLRAGGNEPVVGFPAAQLSKPTHKCLHGDAEGSLLTGSGRRLHSAVLGQHGESAVDRSRRAG
jgi:hypothetical protein